MALDWNESLRTPLSRLPLAFVDVETTGLRADRGDRICEIAISVWEGDREAQRYTSLVNPLRPLSAGAAAVNGLDDATLREAPSFSAIAADVAATLALGVPVAHNAPFDLSFLARELAQASLPPAAPGAVDTLALARRVLPFQRCGLSALACQFAITVPGRAHRALADALTTRELLFCLLQRAGAGFDLSLAELLALQGGPAAWPRTRPAELPPLPPALADAIRPGTPMHIVYLAANGQRTRRLIEPAEVYANGDTLYLVAYCHLRGEQRTFRLDRIVAWEPA